MKPPYGMRHESDKARREMIAHKEGTWDGHGTDMGMGMVRDEGIDGWGSSSAALAGLLTAYHGYGQTYRVAGLPEFWGRRKQGLAPKPKPSRPKLFPCAVPGQARSWSFPLPMLAFPSSWLNKRTCPRRSAVVLGIASFFILWER